VPCAADTPEPRHGATGPEVRVQLGAFWPMRDVFVPHTLSGTTPRDWVQNPDLRRELRTLRNRAKKRRQIRRAYAG
jgi:hypothetical protein